MNRLIEDLLDVTRVDAGRLSVEPEPLSTACSSPTLRVAALSRVRIRCR